MVVTTVTDYARWKDKRMSVTTQYATDRQFLAEEVNQMVLRHVSEYLKSDTYDVRLSDTFGKDLRIDETELWLIQTRFWSHLGVAVPSTETVGIKTVQDFADFAKKRLGERVVNVNG